MSRGRLTVIDDRPSSCAAPAAAPQSEMRQGEFAGNVALVTLGCAKNQVDSEVMLGALVRKGFRPVDDASQADLIVVNTCAFLESAVQEGVDTILTLAQHKEQRCRKLVVAGCMVERYREELQRELPEVDRFISTDELLTVADGEDTTSQCFDAARRPYFLYDESMPRVLSGGNYSSFVKVSEGCNRPCAFCIIPKIRGSLRSRSISSVHSEISSLLQGGTREFNLVAQDLTAYGTDFPEGRGIHSQLAPLLRSLGELYSPADPFWVRLLYAYPVGVSEELVRLIVEAPYICNYLDLPLQHISHPVLKSMRRPLGERGTRVLIEKIRAIAPEIALRTTFIVGFPGETDADIEALLQFVGEGHFAHVGVFTYSQESEALSYSYPDQVPEHVKEERRRIIMECQQAQVERRLEGLIGSSLPVLIDGAHPETDLLIAARTEWQAPETDGEVIINCFDDSLLSGDGVAPSAEELRGRFGRVEVSEVSGYDLVGTLVGVSPAPTR